MKLKLLATACALMLNQSATWAADGEKMVVSKNDGTVVYLLDKLPRITFDNEYLVVTAQGISDRYLLNKIQSISYQNLTSGIGTVKADDVTVIPFIVDGRKLFFNNQPEDIKVTVTNVGATILGSYSIKANEAVSIELPSSGLYIVTINNSVSYKVLVR